ncbi:MAG: pyridoxal-phosphate dependent enzyme [Gammaproteobacteria bacterium]
MQTPRGYSHLHLAHPTLSRLPREFLGDYPTPVQRRRDGPLRLWIKRDDLSHPIYGGNKLRKLEYLLGQAISRGHRSVVTFGAAGSNHALATAVHAAGLGLSCLCILGPQPPSPAVRRTLNAHLALGTTLVPWERRRSQRLDLYRRLFRGPGPAHRPWIIPIGGSTWHGTVGFVNAAYELARQVRDGELPEPALIYLPLGTMGTVAGLATGLAATGLGTRVVAVRVVVEKIADERRTRRLGAKTAELLHRLDPGFPALDPGDLNLEVRDEFLGEGYAVPTPAARRAVDWAARHAGLRLETTYSGKALSALLADADAGRLDRREVLFWNTYNSAPLAMPDDHPIREGLPGPLARYFS